MSIRLELHPSSSPRHSSSEKCPEYLVHFIELLVAALLVVPLLLPGGPVSLIFRAEPVIALPFAGIRESAVGIGDFFEDFFGSFH